MRLVPGGKDTDAEIALLRHLASVGELTALAETLDRSVVYIPAGEFLMGSNAGRDNEQPQRQIYLDAFEIDRYEVTNVQYQRFVKATGRQSPQYWSGDEYPRGQADVPVVGMSWPDADAYCAWAGKRLPTEAEWEKACRGTDARVYPWGDAWDATRANVDVVLLEPQAPRWEEVWASLQTNAGRRGIRAVGSYPAGASPYGVMDMTGNASEWVADWYNWAGYAELPARNPRGLGPPWNRSLRGSAWFDPYGSADWVRDTSRCAARSSSHAPWDPRVGLRCARSVR
jgi:formylglycine-generating enzyme required for sulfatase activity